MNWCHCQGLNVKRIKTNIVCCLSKKFEFGQSKKYFNKTLVAVEYRIFLYKQVVTLTNCQKIINFRQLYRPPFVKNEDV